MELKRRLLLRYGCTIRLSRRESFPSLRKLAQNYVFIPRGGLLVRTSAGSLPRQNNTRFICLANVTRAGLKSRTPLCLPRRYNTRLSEFFKEQYKKELSHEVARWGALKIA